MSVFSRNKFRVAGKLMKKKKKWKANQDLAKLGLGGGQEVYGIPPPFLIHPRSGTS